MLALPSIIFFKRKSVLIKKENTMKKIFYAMVCVVSSFLCSMEQPKDQQSNTNSNTPPRRISAPTHIKVTFPAKGRPRFESDPEQRRIIQLIEPKVTSNSKSEDKK